MSDANYQQLYSFHQKKKKNNFIPLFVATNLVQLLHRVTLNKNRMRLFHTQLLHSTFIKKKIIALNRTHSLYGYVQQLGSNSIFPTKIQFSTYVDL